MSDEINEIVQLFDRLRRDVEEEIQKLTSNSTNPGKPVRDLEANSSGLSRDWTAREDEVLRCPSTFLPSVIAWKSQDLTDSSTNRSTSSLSLSSADETIPQDYLVTDCLANSSVSHRPTDDALKSIREDEKLLVLKPLTRHVTDATNDSAIYRTIYEQPEVAKCSGVTAALPLTKSMQRRTFTTDSDFNITQHDLQNGSSLLTGRGRDLPEVEKFQDESVTHRGSRLPDKMSDYDDVWSSPHHNQRQNRCHKVQEIRKRSINFHQTSEKEKNIDLVMKWSQSKSEIFTNSENQETAEFQSRSKPLGNRQIFEFPKKFNVANAEIYLSNIYSLPSQHRTSQQVLESPNKSKRNEDEGESKEVSTSPSNSAISRHFLKSSYSFKVDKDELDCREVITSPSNPITKQSFHKSPAKCNLKENCVIKDQNANYIPNQSLMESDSVPQDPQLEKKTLEYRRPYDIVPQLTRKYSEAASRDCTSGYAAHSLPSISPKKEEESTETVIMKERFGHSHAACGDVMSKKDQVIVRRSLSESSRTRPCNECLRWPTEGMPDATQIKNAGKPAQESWNSSASPLNKNRLNTEEKQCEETPLPVSNGFSSVSNLRPLTVADIIDKIAPHLSIRQTRGRSSKDTTPTSLYDNVSCETSSPQRTPTSSTYTDYLPPWDDFSVTQLLDCAKRLSQTKAKESTEMHVRGPAEFNSFEQETTGTAQNYQSEESQRCQRPSTIGDGEGFRATSKDEGQLYQKSATKESVVLDSSQDHARNFQDVEFEICGKFSLRSQENDIQQTETPRDVTLNTSKINDIKSLRKRMEEPSRLQDTNHTKARKIETLEIENTWTTDNTQSHGFIELKSRETVREASELQGIGRTRSKSTDTTGTQSKGKYKTQKQANLKTQSTSPQTLNYPIPTVQHQKSPSELPCVGKRRLFPRQLSLPFHPSAPTAPFSCPTPSDVVLDRSTSPDEDPAPKLGFCDLCHVRPTIRLASIPLRSSQSLMSRINCISSPTVAERKLRPVPASESLASKNLLVAHELQAPIIGEEYFGSGSFLKSSLNDLLSVMVKDQKELSGSEPRTTTTMRWTEQVCQEWPSLAYAFQTYGQPKINRILVSYLTGLAEKRDTFLGSLIQTFISCTKQATNRNPGLVCRNVRQFLSGVSKYLTGANCDSEISMFLKVILDETMSSADDDCIEATVEMFLQNSVVRPLKSHIFHLLQEHHSRNGEERLLRLGLEKVSHRSAAELLLKPDLVYQLDAHMDLIKDHFRRLVEADSALSKLEILRGLAAIVFSVITNPRTQPRTSQFVDKAFDQDFLEAMEYLLAEFRLFSAEAEADFIRDLIRPSVLTEVDVYVIQSFERAVNELKKLGVTETDVGKDIITGET